MKNMVDKKYYTTSDVGTPRLPNFDRDEKEAPKSAKWVHVRCPVPPQAGKKAQNYILNNQIPNEEGLIDVQFSTDDNGWISIVVEDESYIDKGAEILYRTVKDIDVKVNVNMNFEDNETDEDETPRYIQ